LLNLYPAKLRRVHSQREHVAGYRTIAQRASSS
jgi:hypothetical protein